ncbi:TetR/AcrR family transcriptional regulator [Microbacterium sp. C7(2022)]|uniref:TetR/AcrR family transcriptional regulator n=1 Tax=Microbacterium sp. C7(2022) TaxID=2992759 RepID=UPI00237C4DC1|nr:TetR/AcrR family transcriptional regulator [Microbacterium sp. C7(2022)]MDE0546690.1 TetR/AcrR family transcriptional regulator [Microbacterium sp. C7(2022)]
MTTTPSATPDAATTTDKPTRGRRGPYASTPARRAQIVRAALASFAEHGYERASLRDIAARAEVTHAALLRHFDSKDDLLLAALALRDADDEELARRIMASDISAERVLSSVLKDEFAHPERQRNWLAITVAATNPEHPAHDFFIARRERMREHFSTDTLGIAGTGDSLTADDKVTLLLAMMDGLRIQALLDPSRDVLPLLETFMRSIARP